MDFFSAKEIFTCFHLFVFVFASFILMTTVFLGGVHYSPFLKKAIYGKEKKYTRIPFLKPLLTKKLNIVNYYNDTFF